METEERTGIKNYLDNVFSDDGLKTDIKITMTDETLRKTSLYLVGSGLVITLIVFGIRGIVKNMEAQ
ncbi:MULTISPECIES: hypothetical protein [Flavobacteriaceae]|jgi:hypothetical protein|uniref:Uncharacterized protein n=3 Tax=Flavobacteriaceae TaxID=49546 RepID=A0A0C5W8S5_9FLAO|nr:MULTISPECIES: hypothetical protein [Flavobacteriaceae]MCB0541279.1 hypothetical protein [Bacteroidota bacterium]MCI5054610.1 hypothetical protein [Flavobacteriales bacterium]MDA8876995.1 hypothetical protein [bacterium]AJR03573.1 hypothetical protein AW14_08000 [Siansivirga zeaxanthinifaciens CC-SAMT-1]AUS04938.1 hypothetical protein C1A40_05390 [Tamlana carrageenivorans]|tara:strand:- start:14862 stop:15062 length:201 start_codon:yes stop_codon:yes gene_type:complete